MNKTNYPNWGFGQRLAEAMWEQNITNKELAAAIQRERKIITAYKYGYSNPDIVTFAKICEKLGKSPNYMLTGKE